MRPTTRRPRHHRGGFTLVELLVAAALALVVMTVLSLAFQTGLQTLSQLKSVVGLAEQMRSAEAVFRRDLGAAHLEADDGRTVRVSAAGGHSRGFFAFTQGGMAQTTSGQQGFGPYAEFRGAGENGVQSFRTQSALQAMTQTGPAGTYTDNPNQVSQQLGRAWMDTLHLTVRLNGDKPQEVFTASAVGDPAKSPSLLRRLQALDPGFASLPVEVRSADLTGNQMTSRWAEVTYLLTPAGPPGTTPVVFTSDEGGVAQLPLYTLYRRQRVLADRTVKSPPSPNPNLFDNLDAQNARGLAMAFDSNPPNPSWLVLGPEALAGNATNRLGGGNDQLAPAIPGSVAPGSPLFADLQRRGYPIPAGTNESGSDLLASNVLSMTVRGVFMHETPQAVLDYIRTNALTSPTVVSPDGLTADPAGRFVSFAPRDLLFPNVTAGAGVNGYQNASQFPRFYDTTGGGFSGTFTVNGNAVAGQITKFSLKAIEIKLRVYDAKNKTSRQMTIVQDL